MFQTTNQILYIYISLKNLEISTLIFKPWDINHASGAPGNIGHTWTNRRFPRTQVDFLHQPVAKNSDTYWIGLRENLQETMVFTIKYRAFL